jgi:ribosome-associated translation inhibitor RaiA
MIRVAFKNLEKSEIAKESAINRIATIIERFPDLARHKIHTTLRMENSPLQAGPDMFSVKLFITGQRFKSIVIEKSSSSLYVALAEVVEHALERLNRYGDKARVKRRKGERDAHLFQR